jgi:uncharacterized membrane protein YfcA
LVYLYQGAIQRLHLPYFALIIIAVSIPAMIGAQMFYKISEIQFKRIVLSLLFASGCFLLFTTLI